MKQKNPNSRFKEFETPWEVKTLQEISQKVIEKNCDSSITEVFTNSAEFGVMSQLDFFSHSIANKKNIDGYYIVRPDDFVYNPRMSVTAPVGPINRNALKRTGIMSPLYYVFRTHDVDVQFLEHFFKTRIWHKFMWSNGDNGARGDRFSIKDDVFQQMPISFPSTPEEQYKIAQFFSRLDTLIAAEDKKLAKLQNMKAASLEKMFPKAGETTPQVRFKGFKGEWVYKALKEIASNFEYGINAPAKSFDGINKYLRITDIDDDLRTFDKTNLTSPDAQDIQSFLLQEGDIVFARTGASVGKSYLYDTKDGVVVYAGYLIKARLDESVCHRFILYATLSARFSNFIRITSQRSGQPGVNSKEYGEYMFQIPPTKEEQIIIADFFSRLDTLISAQEQKLDKLRSLKKSFLEKMFVSTK